MTKHKETPRLGFGVEIECAPKDGGAGFVPALRDALAGAGLRVSYNLWYSNGIDWVVAWESLGFGVTGYEIKTPILYGEEGIADLQRAMRALQPYCKVTQHCGMHVHIDRNHLSPSQLANWALGYMLHEYAIDQLVGYWRRPGYNASNLSSARSRATASRMSVADYVRSRSDSACTVAGAIGSGRRKGPKLSIRSGPTVELRQHQGTLNPARAGHWVRLQLALAATASVDGDLKDSVGNVAAFLRYSGAPEMTRRYYLAHIRRAEGDMDYRQNFEEAIKGPRAA